MRPSRSSLIAGGVHEAHLDVDLRVLGLAVGAQVLVAEAARQLVVAVDAGHHEDLLEHLRRLRQRVEGARLQARRHEEVARPFGRRPGQHGRLDLEEPLLVEVAAGRLRGAVTQLDVGQHGRPAQVEVAVPEAQRLVDLGSLAGLDGEGRRLGLAEHCRLADRDLDLAGRQARVDRLLAARHDLAADLDHELGTHRLGEMVRLGGERRVEHELHETAAVAQVDEDEVAVVAPPRDPAGERHHASDIGAAQRAGSGVATHV